MPSDSHFERADGPSLTAPGPPASNKLKQASIFDSRGASSSADGPAKQSATLRGLPVPPGWNVVGGSLLVRAYMQPTASSKVAAFDYDGCLADTDLAGFNPDGWKMMFRHVPAVLAALVDEGHCLLVVTNESMDRFKKSDVIAKAIAKKCGRLDGFARAVGLPMLVLCATAKDGFCKPEVGCWQHYVATCSAGCAVDMGASFFVGDAAGRPKDHSDSDQKFAANVGLRFFDEREFFLEQRPPPPPV